MTRYDKRRSALAAVALTGILALAACSSSTSTTGSSTPSNAGSTPTTGGTSSSGGGTASGGGKQGGTATVDLGAAPGSLDPQMAYAAGSQDAVWLAYTGLLTYARANGDAGTKVIPGLATALPTITNGGKTYTLSLRSGLKYSNGTPVKAADFAYTIMRAIKLNWGGVSLFTYTIKGAADFQANKATTISGITSDDTTGKITIELNTPYGPFSNVLALSGAGLVPTGTAMKNLATNPPPGLGPYTLNSVTSYGFTMTKAPSFAGYNLPGIPAGHLDTIVIKTQSNALSAAEDVLKNQADAFDPSGVVPGSLLSSITAQAGSRFSNVKVPWTYYFWLNQTVAPFNNVQARLAVATALDRKALVRLSSGQLAAGCNFLPPGIAGHVDGDCVTQTNGADLAKGKQMIAAAGLTGAPVTVWGTSIAPRDSYANYYASLLTSLGFTVTTKLLAPAVYSATISNPTTKAQTGYGDWAQDFPHPVDFTLPYSAAGIAANLNYGRVNDPMIEATITKVGGTPSDQLAGVASQWAAVDHELNAKAQVLPFGYAQLPKFLSSRIDYQKAIFSLIYYNDYSSWQLVS